MVVRERCVMDLSLKPEHAAVCGASTRLARLAWEPPSPAASGGAARGPLSAQAVVAGARSTAALRVVQPETALARGLQRRAFSPNIQSCT